MAVILGILAGLIGLALILVVVIQNSKGGGLSSAFGASNLSNVVGARRSAQEIEKITWWLIGIVMVVAFVTNIAFKSGGETTQETNYSVEEIIQQSVDRQTVTQLPSIPTSPQTVEEATGGNGE